MACPRTLVRRLSTSAVRWRNSGTSSTSAIAYKATHRRAGPLPTPHTKPASWSASAAVHSIYESRLPSSDPETKHILNCLVQNEPGALSRISNVLAARGFNIDSLVVCQTEVPDLSRMTIVLKGHEDTIEQARRQLEDQVPVWAVLNYTNVAVVQREILLAKINILGPEHFEEFLAHHQQQSAEEGSTAQESDATLEAERLANGMTEGFMQDYHPRRLAPSEALRHKYAHLRNITHLTHQFGGKVVDVSDNSCIVELCAKPSRVDNFLKLIDPFGILESSRTGKQCTCFDFETTSR